MSHELEPLLVNKENAAKMLGIGPTALNRLIASGKLTEVVLGRRTVRLSVEAIKRLIKDHQQPVAIDCTRVLDK